MRDIEKLITALTYDEYKAAAAICQQAKPHNLTLDTLVGIIYRHGRLDGQVQQRARDEAYKQAKLEQHKQRQLQKLIDSLPKADNEGGNENEQQ